MSSEPIKISKNKIIFQVNNFFFQQNLNIFKILIFCQKKKNAILLVLSNEEISLRPELSSPAHLTIQGGYPEHDGGAAAVGVAGRYFPFLIQDSKVKKKIATQLQYLFPEPPILNNSIKQITPNLCHVNSILAAILIKTFPKSG